MTENTPFRLIVRFQIKPGKIEDFKRWSEAYVLKVEDTEPGTLAYEWFVDEAGTDAYQNEVYADSQSFLLHLANWDAQLDSALEVVSVEDIRVLGDPDKQVADMLSALGARVYSRHTGFAR
jgi:quinol monooxygenase YgiN